MIWLCTMKIYKKDYDLINKITNVKTSIALYKTT